MNLLKLTALCMTALLAIFLYAPLAISEDEGSSDEPTTCDPAAGDICLPDDGPPPAQD